MAAPGSRALKSCRAEFHHDFFSFDPASQFQTRAGGGLPAAAGLRCLGHPRSPTGGLAVRSGLAAAGGGVCAGAAAFGPLALEHLGHRLGLGRLGRDPLPRFAGGGIRGGGRRSARLLRSRLLGHPGRAAVSGRDRGPVRWLGTSGPRELGADGPSIAGQRSCAVAAARDADLSLRLLLLLWRLRRLPARHGPAGGWLGVGCPACPVVPDFHGHRRTGGSGRRGFHPGPRRDHRAGGRGSGATDSRPLADLAPRFARDRPYSAGLAAGGHRRLLVAGRWIGGGPEGARSRQRATAR